MSKYIIDIEEKPLCVFDKDTQTYFPRLWRVKGFNSLVFDEEGLNRLEVLNPDYINKHFGQLQDEAYQKGYEDGCATQFKPVSDAEYQRGLKDGKAQAERGCDGCQFDGTEIYIRPCGACRNAYPNQWTAKKSIDSEFNVGDEVQLYDCSPTSLTGVVLPPLDNDACRVMWSDASVGTWDKDTLYKTGRRFNIGETLEKMKGSENR